MGNESQQGISLTYIIGTYPGLTTTFIDREVTILRRLGVQLKIISIRYPWTKLSQEQKALQDGVIYLLPVRKRTFLAGFLRFALFHPRRFFGTLTYLLSRPHPSLSARAMTLMHFIEGVYAAEVMRRSPTHHLHAHFIDRAATVALVTSRLLNIPYSVTAHASDIYVSPVLLREKLAGSKFVATCTGYNRDYLAKFGENLFNHKLVCIYHGLEANRYVRNPMPSEKPVILSVGQLKERKGFRYLVEACKLLHEQGLDFECRIIGEGPLREDLEQQIRSLGLQTQVILCGALPHEEVIAQYEQAAIFTLPAILGADGDRDGIPNVILEALAMELPVVSTDHSGIPEVIEDGVTGLLVPPENAQALAAALAHLLTHPQAGRDLGRTGRRVVTGRFDPEANARMLLKAFTA